MVLFATQRPAFLPFDLVSSLVGVGLGAGGSGSPGTWPDFALKRSPGLLLCGRRATAGRTRETGAWAPRVGLGSVALSV